MDSIEGSDAEAHLPALLARVERGGSILITKRGRPVARLVPVEGASDLTVSEAIKRIKGLRKVNLERTTIKEIISAGRRY